MNIKTEKDLAKAINNSKGAEILLENKTYNLSSTIEIDKPVKLIGQANTKLIINRLDQNGILVTSSNVEISNITIEQNAKSFKVPEHSHFKTGGYEKRSFIKKGNHFNSGIRIAGADDVTIKNCTFNNWLGDGVFVYGGSKINIENNSFYSPYYLMYTADIQVKGLPASPSSDIKIVGNKCNSNNRHGISVGNGGFVSDVLVQSNDVICDHKDLGSKLLRNHGILAFYGADHVPENSNIRIYNNTVSGTRNTGIYVPGGYQVSIKGNKVSNVGLIDGVKISGGILVGNDLESVLIEGNSIDNYQGSFDERGAIGTFGGTKGFNGEIIIRGNTIRNSTNGIAIDQEFSNVLVEGNTTMNVEKFNLYLRRNINVKKLKGKVEIVENDFNENLIDSIPSVNIEGKNIVSVKIANNKIIGKKESTCFRVNSDQVEIEENEIQNFGDVLELKSKGKKKRKLKMENNTMTNVTEVVSKKSSGHESNLEQKNTVIKRNQ